MEINKTTTHWRTCDRTTLMADEGRGIIQIDYPKDMPEVGWIWNLWVQEPHRNSGIGRMLLQTAEDEIKANGKKTIILEWDERDSERYVLEWYMRRGYNDTGFGKYGCKLEKKI